MPTRKMRVELFDTEGNKYSISFEGQITRDKATRLLDLVELLGGVPPVENGSNAEVGSLNSELSKYEKVRVIVRKHFPITWFSSHEVQTVYEQELKETISLSTVATYLSRLAERGSVLKAGPPNSLKYKLASNAPQVAVKQKIF